MKKGTKKGSKKPPSKGGHKGRGKAAPKHNPKGRAEQAAPKARKLADKPKKPRESRLKPAALYGFHAVEAAWLNPQRHIEALYCTQNALDGFEGLIHKARKNGLERPAPTLVDKNDLEAALPPGAVHQGLGLVCAPLPELGIEDILIRLNDAENALIVILDQVTDPHNVGAILRSACAFNADAVIMQTKHAPELNGVLAKTACGALEHIPVVYETNLSRSIERLQEDGYFVYGLDERGEDIGSIDTAAKSVLVLGAEGPGIRRLVKEHCDTLLRLPMSGQMPSINVSNAAAVALYEFSKR